MIQGSLVELMLAPLPLVGALAVLLFPLPVIPRCARSLGSAVLLLAIQLMLFSPYRFGSVRRAGLWGTLEQEYRSLAADVQPVMQISLVILIAALAGAVSQLFGAFSGSRIGRVPAVAWWIVLGSLMGCCVHFFGSRELLAAEFLLGKQWYLGWLVGSELVGLGTMTYCSSALLAFAIRSRAFTDAECQSSPTTMLLRASTLGLVWICASSIRDVALRERFNYGAPVNWGTDEAQHEIWRIFEPLSSASQQIVAVTAVVGVSILMLERNRCRVFGWRFFGSGLVLACGLTAWAASRPLAAKADEPLSVGGARGRWYGIGDWAENWDASFLGGMPLVVLDAHGAWMGSPRLACGNTNQDPRVDPERLQAILEEQRMRTAERHTLVDRSVALLVDPHLPLAEALPFLAAARAAGYEAVFTERLAKLPGEKTAPVDGPEASMELMVGRLSEVTMPLRMFGAGKVERSTLWQDYASQLHRVDGSNVSELLRL